MYELCKCYIYADLCRLIRLGKCKAHFVDSFVKYIVKRDRKGKQSTVVGKSLDPRPHKYALLDKIYL